MRKTRKVYLGMLLLCTLVLIGCGEEGDWTNTGTSPERVSSGNAEDAVEDMTGDETVRSETQTDDKENVIDKKGGDEDNMQLTIGGTAYEVELDDNITIDDIVKKLPLELTLTRYAGHEYYSELPFTPSFAEETTSDIKAGHVYYWDGWNAFVINYEDTDIAPYQVVHIGEIKSKDVSEMLKNADETIGVSVNAG